MRKRGHEFNLLGYHRKRKRQLPPGNFSFLPPPSGLLDGRIPLLGRHRATARSSLNNLVLLSHNLARVLASEHDLHDTRHSGSALPSWVDTNDDKTDEDPDDANGDPAGEELLREDVSTTVHGHGPQDQE